MSVMSRKYWYLFEPISGDWGISFGLIAKTSIKTRNGLKMYCCTLNKYLHNISSDGDGRASWSMILKFIFLRDKGLTKFIYLYVFIMIINCKLWVWQIQIYMNYYFWIAISLSGTSSDYLVHQQTIWNIIRLSETLSYYLHFQTFKTF